MRLIQKNNLSKKELIKQVALLEEKCHKLETQQSLSSVQESYDFISAFTSQVRGNLFLVNFQSEQVEPITIKDPDLAFIDSSTGFTNFYKSFAPDYQNALKDLLSRKKKNKEFEGKLISPNKENVIFNITLIESNSDNNKGFLLITNTSVQYKSRKELIKQKRKAEEADHLKTLFLSNISHHIRTPMNSIVGFAELLTLADPGTEKRKEYLHIIKKQSKGLLEIIDDVSEIAKFESGSQNISKVPCNLNLLLKEIESSIDEQRITKRKDLVKIEINTPEGNGHELLTDSGRIQQVINNIINFSLKHTEEGTIKIGYDVSDERVTFHIKDNSKGFQKNDLRNIFKKFITLENNDKVQYEDSGLGLTIAKQVVKALGGKIWVDLDTSGLNFFFTIPNEKMASETIEIEEDGEINYDWRNKIILIVEDEEVNGMFLEAVFQETQAQTLYAKNGLQAIELCKNINKIDLILMDIKMPVMNGLKATSEIRKFNQHIPIIAQTALAGEEDKEQCILVGCNDTITKPIEVEELLTLVDRYLID